MSRGRNDASSQILRRISGGSFGKSVKVSPSEEEPEADAVEVILSDAISTGSCIWSVSFSKNNVGTLRVGVKRRQAGELPFRKSIDVLTGPHREVLVSPRRLCGDRRRQIVISKGTSCCGPKRKWWRCRTCQTQAFYQHRLACRS
jgi:hypothetical protein